jgi:putative ABC transport system substrate-binding protein
MARELVDAKVDVIVAVTQRGAIEVKKATTTIPTVFVLVSDPVADGLVESLSHPGSNMTGTSLMGSDLTGKRLAMLKEAIPSLRRVAFVYDFQLSPSSAAITSFMKTAGTMGLVGQPIQVLKPDDIEPAFSAISRDGFDAAFVFGSMMFNERRQIGALALAHKMPTMAIIAEMVPYGLLMSYGQDFPDYFRKAAATVDKILKGAKPAAIPVEQPTRFKQTLNLKVAKSLGLVVPSSLLLGADEVIE